METYCSIWVFWFCKHPMRTVLYKTNKPKSIYQEFGLFVLYNRAMGCSPRNRKSRLTANHWDDRRNSSPPDFGRDGKGRQREKRSRMFVRLWQENISCQQHKSKTARNCEMLDWYVLLCQKRDEVP